MKFYSVNDDMEFMELFFRLLRKRAPPALRDYASSLRRQKSFANYLMSLYMRKGARVPEDYLNAAVLTLVPELQELGRKIAYEILFGIRSPDGGQEKEDEGGYMEDEGITRTVLSYIWGESSFSEIIRSLRKGEIEKDAERLKRFIKIYEELTGRSWAGPGRDRLLRWNFHEVSLGPEYLRLLDFIVKLGRSFSKRLMERRGWAGEYQLRNFEPGDDPESIDYEATIENLRDQGKGLEHLRYDDILIREAKRDKWSVIFLHDISGSMGNLLSVTNVILAALVYVFRHDDYAIGLFTDDFYSMKELDERVDEDALTRSILSLYPHSGTVLYRGLDWAEEQLDKSRKDSKRLCVILGDFRFYWPELTYEKMGELILKGVKVVRLSVRPMTPGEAALTPLIRLDQTLNASSSLDEFLSKTLDELFRVLLD